ncbi:MAG: type II secretion system protein [Sedimentisphaerales bacterium]|nr:type II secretion system protein [Sedimentisphaerales bacterium]
MFGRRNFQPAFTLVELLVVLGIIALLMAILVPCLGKALSQAQLIQCKSNLRQINLGVDMYLENNNDIYPCAEDEPNDVWLWMGRGWRPFIQPYLGGNIDEENPSVLFCPADKVSSEIYGSTSYAYSMAFYHSPAQINNMSSPSDNYTNPQPFVVQKRFSVKNPTGKILIGEWLSVHERISTKDSGWWCWEGSRNYLFADGSVQYLKAKKIRPARDGNPNPNLTVDGIKGTDWPK